jgi:hypothetical protein
MFFGYFVYVTEKLDRDMQPFPITAAVRIPHQYIQKSFTSSTQLTTRALQLVVFLSIAIGVSNNDFSGLGSLSNLALDRGFHTFGGFAGDAAYSLFNDTLRCLDTINAHQLSLEDYNPSARA